MNIVVIEGVLSRPAETRELESGTTLVSLDVTTRTGDGPAESVPVSWFDAPASATTLDQGARVVVLGRVRRRFWRNGGGPTQSRTDVLAEQVVTGTQRKRVGRLLAEATARLDAPEV